jgi:hypothetical protein
VNVFHALPESPFPPPRAKSRRNIYAILLSAFLIFLLAVASIIAFGYLMGSMFAPSQKLTSSDWSGYSVSSDLYNPQPLVTSVNASWTVAAVNVSIGNSYSAVWVGLGGQFDNSLIQMGTEQDSVNGQASYSAWYELLPADAVTVDSLSVSPGDIITASISLVDPTTNTWSVEISDVTDGQSFKKSLVYDSSMLSAEWIVERPTVNNRIAALANFGQMTFTDCRATVNGKAGTIGSFPHSPIVMINRQNMELVTVSSLSSNGSSFTVNYRD